MEAKTLFYKRTGPVSVTQIYFSAKKVFSLVSDARLKIVAITGGSATIEINGIIYTLKKGDVFILSAVDIRQWKSVSDTEGLEILMASFPPMSNISATPFFVRKADFVNKIPDKSVNDRLFSLLLMLREFIETDDSYTFVSSMVGVMCEYVKKAYLSILPDADNEFVTKALGFLHANAKSEISCIDAARAMNLSSSHFSRKFKASVGISFSSYLRQYRIYLVLGELQHSDLSITECAYKCGFSSSAGFYKAFNQITGTNPSKYLQGC
ncbi:MAG: helix-turn-helix transcriptional regulator [Clostridia bacterium]|nr:helix-turn-helix transcriptional regulator [Clostridia bacterium]